MRNDTMTFYQFYKEYVKKSKKTVGEGDDEIRLVEDDGTIPDQDKFDNNRKKAQQHFEEILCKINRLDKYKVQKAGGKIEFEIPFAEKEWIEFVLDQYSSPFTRKIRKERIEEITPQDAEETFKTLEDFINSCVPDTEREKEIGTAYSMTQWQSRKAFELVEKGLLLLIDRDLNQVREKEAKENGKTKKIIRISNDSDAAFLMLYYLQLMRDTSRYWNKVVDVFSGLRDEDIIQISDSGREIGTEKPKEARVLLGEACDIVEEEEEICRLLKTELL